MSPLRVAITALVAALLVTPSARAISGALDDVPGAVLLLPYFEVDLDDPNGAETVFTVHNSSAGPILADVLLVTDWGVSTLNFTIFLGPRAVQEISLRDVFLGRFPDIDPVPACPTLGPIAPTTVAGAVTAHRGEATALFGGFCAGHPFADGLLRGFALISFPSQCSSFATAELPAATQGAAAPQGINPEAANVLWGDYVFVERTAGVAVGELLPALEVGFSLVANTASLTTAPLIFPGLFPELPPRIWGIPFSIGDGNTTEVIVLHLPIGGGLLTSIPCGAPPNWFPLGQTELTAFDEDGVGVSLDSFRPFPLVTNRVTAGLFNVSFPVPFNEGWLRADLLLPPFAILSGGGGPPLSFSYAAVLQRSDGRASLQRALALPTPVVD